MLGMYINTSMTQSVCFHSDEMYALGYSLKCLPNDFISTWQHCVTLYSNFHLKMRKCSWEINAMFTNPYRNVASHRIKMKKNIWWWLEWSLHLTISLAQKKNSSSYILQAYFSVQGKMTGECMRPTKDTAY